MHRTNQIKILTGLVLLGISLALSCSNNPTDPNDSDINGDSELPVLYLTGSDYDGRNQVDNYSHGDSVYVVAREYENNRPAYAPLWVYAYESGDQEIYLMHSHWDIIPESSRWRLSFLPNPETGIAHFNGTLRVMADGDSITVFYFSQTYRKIVTAGARIGNP